MAAEALPNRVLLVDLDLSFGQVASHLNLLPKQTLLELTRDEAALRDTELFRTYVIHHASGLHILASPPSPTFAALITTEQVETAMARAVEAYDVVVVDAGTAVDQRLTMLFSQSEAVVVPVMPEIPALNAIHTSARPARGDGRDRLAHAVRAEPHVLARPAQDVGRGDGAGLQDLGGPAL